MLVFLELMTRSPARLPADLAALLARGGGYVTAAEAREAGLHAHVLERLTARGRLERAQRGVYRDTSVPPPENAELLEVQLRVPYARPCLATAAFLHGLTTTLPTRVQVAVPANRAMPTLEYPPLEPFYWSPVAYGHGVTTLPGGERSLTTYTPEKTIADLLKHAPRLGPDLYLEALKTYLAAHRHPDTAALLAAAKVDGVEAQLRH
ncbi:MAG TPA: type IV toxin-antitoxin system AbiEi family antitoxin domain-containing protein, partial [Deinococcales bacterium]|nr:type IV toxin-antitoxin system AbiEi family antitoxin domain-containing protein [Deinococcales bacterium]